MSSLQDLARQVIDLIGEEIDAVTLADTLEGLEGEIEDKIRARALAIKIMNRDAASYRDLAKDFTMTARTLERRAEWLSEDTAAVMLRLDKTAVSGAPNVTYKANAKVIIDNKASLPLEFQTLNKPSYYPDKTAIREQLLSGNAIPGAHLANGIRIK